MDLATMYSPSKNGLSSDQCQSRRCISPDGKLGPRLRSQEPQHMLWGPPPQRPLASWRVVAARLLWNLCVCLAATSSSVGALVTSPAHGYRIKYACINHPSVWTSGSCLG